MKELLLADLREHPLCYDVEVRGKWERTVSIRGGISWPQAGVPGYFIVVAQLEEKDKDQNLRFLAFYERQANLLRDLFSKIASMCNACRVDSLWHGDTEDEKQFCYKLIEYLQIL
jgi:hypothetical protein